MNTNRNETVDITTEIEEIKKNHQNVLQSLYSIHQGYLDEMENFLVRCKIPKINRDQRDNINSPTTPKETEVVIEILPTKKKEKKKNRTRWI